MAGADVALGVGGGGGFSAGFGCCQVRQNGGIFVGRRDGGRLIGYTIRNYAFQSLICCSSFAQSLVCFVSRAFCFATNICVLRVAPSGNFKIFSNRNGSASAQRPQFRFNFGWENAEVSLLNNAQVFV